MLVEKTGKKVAGRKRNRKGLFLADNSKRESKLCLICKKEFICYKHANRKYCSHSCYGKSLNNKRFPNKRFIGKREKNHFWNGGITFQKAGYKMILNRSHPFCNMRGYVAEHRIVMENKIGRYLTKQEVVHHINGDVVDNRIENLMLFKNNSEHMRYHYARR
jgi:hypothetical protein